MYNMMAPYFGHEPIRPAPMFPTTDKFLTDYKSKQMTEQSLIEYAKLGHESAIAHLAGAGFDGVDWSLAITHINGGILPGHQIKKVWGEMVKIHHESSMSMEDISKQLQAALDKHHAPAIKAPDLVAVSPADRPWDFKQKNGFRFGQRGTNRMPPKKKRRK
jgi:hypothetical protein